MNSFTPTDAHIILKKEEYEILVNTVKNMTENSSN
jgi:hypothetical protein